MQHLDTLRKYLRYLHDDFIGKYPTMVPAEVITKQRKTIRSQSKIWQIEAVTIVTLSSVYNFTP
jgi:hypothetical protein